VDIHVKEIAEECARGSDEGRLPFPQVVRKLTEAGVERYLADLQRAEKTFYTPDGKSCLVATAAVEAAAAKRFSAAGVEAALRQIQAGEISYKTFCERIMKAGCVGYIVSIVGRRVVYYGREGEIYIEPFPGSR
jgi:uncharacterized protein YbcV (DUF1398 family)